MDSPAPFISVVDYYLLAAVVLALIVLGALLSAHLSLRARVARLEGRVGTGESRSSETEEEVRWLNSVLMQYCRDGGVLYQRLTILLAEGRGWFGLYAPEVLRRAEEAEGAAADPGKRRVVSVGREP